MTADYKQAQRNAEAASKRRYIPTPDGRGLVRSTDGALYLFTNKQAKKLIGRFTGRAARWRRRILQRAAEALARKVSK